MRRVFAVLALLSLPAVETAAQTRARPAGRPASSAAARSEPGVFGTAPFGGRHFGGSLRLVADLSGHYGTFGSADLSQLTFLAGPRLAWNRGRVRPFAHVMVGGARTRRSLAGADPAPGSSDTDWGGAVGAGGDYRLARRWAVRGQADLLLLSGEGVRDANPRLSLGAVYRFGR